MAKPNPEASFLKSIASHKLTILQDDGVHRCLAFRDQADSFHLHFFLTTWPGHLCISGDAGTFVFSRIDDMFSFFRVDPRGRARLPINPDYWAEKCEAQDARGSGMDEFDKDAFKGAVKAAFTGHWKGAKDRAAKKECWEALESEVLGAESLEEAHRLAYEFSHEGFRLEDFFENRLTRPTRRFIWCLYAIAWGIRQYDAAKSPKSPAKGKIIKA
jgi:hypothetical protein